MKKSTTAVLLVLSALTLLIPLTSFAQITGQKAGLWELKLIKQVMDGKDITAQLQASQEQMRQAMAKMTPDQRAKMEAMMGGAGADPSGMMKVCVSPEMIAKNQMMATQQQQCPPAKVSHSGNQTTFEINCAKDGRTTTGTGTSVLNGDTITTDMNMQITDARGKRTMQSQSQMTYLGSDCKGVIPADQLMNKR
jgi:hypothetical protein